MSRTFVMTMKRPHETLNIPLPFGRKVSGAGKGWWLACFWVATACCIGIYLYQVSRDASKGFVMRDLEKQTDALRDNVDALQRQYVAAQSLESLQNRLQGLGYVPVDQVDYLDGNATAYALAK